jgi:hypothetical protein
MNKKTAHRRQSCYSAGLAILFLLGFSSLSLAQAANLASVGLINAKAITLPQPVMPPAARVVNASGAVVVAVTVDELGHVVLTAAVSGHPLLRKAAEDAAAKAEFEPFLANGKAVKASGTLVYNFGTASSSDQSSTGGDNGGNAGGTNAPGADPGQADKNTRNQNPVGDATEKTAVQTGTPPVETVKALLRAKFTSNQYATRKETLEFESINFAQPDQGVFPARIKFTRVVSDSDGTVKRWAMDGLFHFLKGKDGEWTFSVREWYRDERVNE